MLFAHSARVGYNKRGMKTAMRSVSAPLSGLSMQKLRAYWLLSKPRVTILVWLTTVAGLVLGGWGQTLQGELIAATLIGSWLVIASANALNQAIEWRRDAQMPRTALRPIPSGQLSPLEGWLIGTLWGVLGVLTLAVWVNGAVAWLGAVSILLYAFGYTPLKPRTHFSTAIGAIPGAIPPMAGWVAAQGASRWRRGCYSRCSSRGSSRTFGRLRGFIGRTTRVRGSACCLTQTPARWRRHGSRSDTRWRWSPLV
jgi:heme O synthase-like polyprenyltransferase